MLTVWRCVFVFSLVLLLDYLGQAGSLEILPWLSYWSFAGVFLVVPICVKKDLVLLSMYHERPIPLGCSTASILWFLGWSDVMEKTGFPTGPTGVVEQLMGQSHGWVKFELSPFGDVCVHAVLMHSEELGSSRWSLLAFLCWGSEHWKWWV